MLIDGFLRLFGFSGILQGGCLRDLVRERTVDPAGSVPEGPCECVRSGSIALTYARVQVARKAGCRTVVLLGRVL